MRIFVLDFVLVIISVIAFYKQTLSLGATNKQVYFGKTREMVLTLREPLDTLTATSATGQSIQQNVISGIIRSRT